MPTLQRETIDFLYQPPSSSFPAMPTTTYSLQDGIALVVLTNPPMNPMRACLLEELATLFEGLAANPRTRRGSGHPRWRGR